jgi:hypothetical protein
VPHSTAVATETRNTVRTVHHRVHKSPPFYYCSLGQQSRGTVLWSRCHGLETRSRYGAARTGSLKSYGGNRGVEQSLPSHRNIPKTVLKKTQSKVIRVLLRPTAANQKREITSAIFMASTCRVCHVQLCVQVRRRACPDASVRGSSGTRVTGNILATSSFRRNAY